MITTKHLPPLNKSGVSMNYILFDYGNGPGLNYGLAQNMGFLVPRDLEILQMTLAVGNDKSGAAGSTIYAALYKVDPPAANFDSNIPGTAVLVGSTYPLLGSSGGRMAGLYLDLRKPQNPATFPERFFKKGQQLTVQYNTSGGPSPSFNNVQIFVGYRWTCQ
mgnify:CR=1 FL=1